MNEIKKLTEVIRNFNDGELCLVTFETLKMIEDESSFLCFKVKQLEKEIEELKESLTGQTKNDERGIR